jgi:hypothetical protein
MMILSQYHIFELDTVNIYSARVQQILDSSYKWRLICFPLSLDCPFKLVLN